MSYTAPKNALEQKLQNTRNQLGQPINEQQRIGYAIITSVNHESSQVKIRLLSGDGIPGDEVEGGFLPLLNSLEDVHLRFGSLREGLVCRIYWKGKLEPKNPMVEVIGDEDFSFLRKEPLLNEVEIGPFRMFSAGF